MSGSPVRNCFFLRNGDHRCLHSFPTRRSSDLSVLSTSCRRRLTVPSGMSRVVAISLMGISSRKRSATMRSEEHTSELQSHVNLVCRLLLEKKKLQYAHRSSLNAGRYFTLMLVV